MQLNAQAQVFISEKWSGTGGLTEVFHHNVTVTDASKNIYVAGSTINDWGNHDIILQKFDRNGDLLWQQTYNGQANLDDMAADIFVDDSNNVYVTGASTESLQAGFDLCVLKYSSQGALLWSYFYDNGASPLPMDAGTAIIGDNDGSILVTGGSMGTNTMSDFVTIRLNASNGNEIWVERYDYDGFNDLAARIAITDGKVVVAGASQISASPDTWELATLTYAISDGDWLAEQRTTGSATDGVDEISDITLDEDFIYLAGAVYNSGNDFDIRIYKLDEDLNIVWEVDFDGYQGVDKARGIKVDADGFVYVAGFVTNPTEGRNYITLKYDSAGNLIWSREYNGQANADDEAVQLVIDEHDRIFVTGKLQNSNYTDFVTIGYYSNGDPFGQAVFYSPDGLNDSPAGITIDLDGNLIVTGQGELNGGGMRTYTVKYQVYDKPIELVMVDSVASHNANELLIRFDRSAMKYEAVDNRSFVSGELSEFLRPEAINKMNDKVAGVDFEKVQAFKVFKRMNSSDSLSLTRLGDTLRLDDFWATLSIFLPEHVDLEIVSDTLNTLYPLVRFSCLNDFYAIQAVPNDELVGSDEQASLMPSSNFLNAHINVLPAWDVSTGSWSYFAPKVGVYDSPVYWAHEDFGNGSFVGSKIKGGYDANTDVHISNILTPHESHGTAVAGIIGALRNNGKGIAGIAGGDVDGNGTTGADLYSFGIFSSSMVSGNNQSGFVGVASVANAIQEGAIITPDGSYGYGLEIQNHSWSGAQPNPLIREAIEWAWRNNCAIVASRGNDGTTQLRYPACYDDAQVMSVIASGNDGERKFEQSNGIEDWSSNYGGNADFMAPGSADVVSSTIFSGEPFSFPQSNCTSDLFPDYQCFPGTSASAAHVTGVAALMMAKHNVHNGAPNNLAPEDIEKILEKTANGSGNYTQEEGWGLINAGDALNAVNHPEYYVIHPQLTDIQESVVTDVNFILAVSSHGLAAGAYWADRHHIQFTYQITLPSNHEIIDWWPLESKIFKGLSAAVPNSGEPWMLVNSSVDLGSNTATITMETYTWWVKQHQVTQQYIYQAIPNFLNVGYGYSLHVKNNSITSERPIQDSKLKVYPNPTSNYLFLDLENEVMGDVRFSMFDAVGNSVIDGVYSGINSGIITVDITKLSNGLYVCKVQSGIYMYTSKIIVQK